MVVDILTGRNKITFSKSLFNQMGVGILAFCVFETFIEKSTLEKKIMIEKWGTKVVETIV